MKLKDLTLSMEQMQHLKSLGVDTTKAATVLIYKDEDGNEVSWDDVTVKDGRPTYIEYDGEEYALYEDYLDAENGDYDHSYREDCGVFSLAEILLELNTRGIAFKTGPVDKLRGTDVCKAFTQHPDLYKMCMQLCYGLLCDNANKGV